MLKKVVIIGFGSIGRRHAKILKKNPNIKDVFVLTNQNCPSYIKIKSLKEINKINPDYIIISSETSKHFTQLNYIEKNFKNKIVLVEKPVFEKNRKLTLKNNKVFVGYNMRFNPIIKKIRKIILNRKIWSVNVFCGSYLPNWRKNIDYSKSSSAIKKKGGGVLLDLSHELDYLRWIFGDFKIKYVINKKISDLKINTDDFLCLTGKFKKKIYLQLNLNYFTREAKRQILIDGKDLSISANLINKNMIFHDKKKIYKIKYNFNRDYTYKEQHRNIMNKKFTNCCTLKDAQNIMSIINKIRKFK